MMNNKIKLLLTFAGGAVAGATAMYLYFKSQFEMVEDITEDESDTKGETKEETKEESVKRVDPDSKKVNGLVNEYNDLVKKHGYKPLEPIAEAKIKEKAAEDGLEQFCHIDGIEIIPPDEFEVEEGYELETLFYLRDGVVIDGDDHVIDDPTSMVGDAPHYFGSNPGDEDTVYIRNEEKMTKYELLREDRTSEEYFEEDFPRSYQHYNE